jgi:hypothetical protein
MTTRFLTTDQNGNGDQTYWDINGYFLHGPSGEKLNLGGGNTTVTASNEIVQIGTSYLRIPQGISNERPNPSYAGMIRYLTTDNIIEYYDGNLQQWLPISQPPPTLNTVSPAYFNIGTDNSFNLTGSSFGLTGASIVVIGNNGSGTIINSTVSSVLTESSAVVEFDISATQNLTDISNELPFAVRITNNNSGLSSLLQNAITNANVGPIIIQPNPQTVPFQTFPVQDPSASYYLIGEDESSPTHYPFPSNGITITSGTAGGITDVSFIEPSGALISVPSGSRTLTTAGNYPFNVRVEDGSGAVNNTTLTLALADPIVISIVPSTIKAGISVDLSVNGNYFVNDSGVSYVKQSDGSVVSTTTTYNSITSLETNVTFPNSGIYDISVNNGSVFKLYTSVLTVVLNSLNLSGFAVSDISTTYLDSGGIPVVSPDLNGETVVTLFSTTNTTTITGSITPNFDSSLCQILLVGGGGGGGDRNNFDGGGGAGGYRYLTGQTLTASTTYSLQIGGGGAKINNGGQTNFNGGNICDGGGRGSIYPPPNPPYPSPVTGASGGSSGGSSGYGGGGGTSGSVAPVTGNGNGNTGGQGGSWGSPYGDAGGGGGGAGASGGSNNNTNNCTKGGNGLQNSITGIATYYAGGGAGRGSAGGLGGGGGLNDIGSSYGRQGENGKGGGGQVEGVGGNGVIIIRFPTLN